MFGHLLNLLVDEMVHFRKIKNKKNYWFRVELLQHILFELLKVCDNILSFFLTRIFKFYE